ncbi:hypothetical protein [Psychrobacillus phage Perkons]|nr:hypothetical protein [Psychrobacillus phage Perkons]
MKKKKFPVKGEFGEYQISIEEDDVGFGLLQLIGHVQIKREHKKFYQKEFKTLYSCETGWNNYNTFIVDLIGLAIHTVNTYEDTIRFENEKILASKEFDEWDGDMN